MDGPPAGPALRRPPDSARRLSNAAQLLDCLPTRTDWRARVDGRAHPGWRGFALPARRADAGGPVRGPRADRRLFRLGREPRRPAVAGRGRLGCGAADGYAPASCRPALDRASEDSL